MQLILIPTFLILIQTDPNLRVFTQINDITCYTILTDTVSSDMMMNSPRLPDPRHALPLVGQCPQILLCPLPPQALFPLCEFRYDSLIFLLFQCLLKEWHCIFISKQIYRYVASVIGCFAEFLNFGLGIGFLS